MEPSLIGWEWLDDCVVEYMCYPAAMEPSLIGWEWRHSVARCP